MKNFKGEYMNFLSYTLPKFIKRNDFNEHKYLLPIFYTLLFLVSSALNNFIDSIFVIFVVFIVFFCYYIYLIFNIINNDYNFDTKDLNLGKKADKFLKSTTAVYEDEIRFLMSRMDFSIELNSEDYDVVFAEIEEKMKKSYTDLRVVFLCGNYGKDLTKVNIELIEAFLKTVDVNLTKEAILQLEAVGVNVVQSIKK